MNTGKLGTVCRSCRRNSGASGAPSSKVQAIQAGIQPQSQAHLSKKRSLAQAPTLHQLHAAVRSRPLRGAYSPLGRTSAGVRLPLRTASLDIERASSGARTRSGKSQENATRQLVSAKGARPWFKVSPLREPAEPNWSLNRTRSGRPRLAATGPVLHCPSAASRVLPPRSG